MTGADVTLILESRLPNTYRSSLFATCSGVSEDEDDEGDEDEDDVDRDDDADSSLSLAWYSSCTAWQTRGMGPNTVGLIAWISVRVDEEKEIVAR